MYQDGNLRLPDRDYNHEEDDVYEEEGPVPVYALAFHRKLTSSDPHTSLEAGVPSGQAYSKTPPTNA